MFAYQRRYTGPVRAVVLDWAGTAVDFGCLAPAAVFRRIFADAGVPVSVAEARAFMGRHKRDHIQAMLATPPIRQRWQDAHGRAAGEADVDRLFADFVPQQLAALADHHELIPGAAETAAELRRRGIAIGSTSGYTREMMDRVTGRAAANGYAPDAVVAVDEVRRGRPAPFMAQRAMERLDVWPAAACVKVGDTLSDVEEGLNAGMWTIALAVSGNEVGLSLADWRALPPDRQQALRDSATARLASAGAHRVIDTIADLPAALDAIEAAMARGEGP
ncbi:phosphonoacetaldehyde hydrolase [Rhodovibrio sodomensis]|uniref:Phosphonoacetaldehyde hydrolase n=1 Tax=Rhodovibrio sodomensis TaxID=1088 RepID=A0ABS1DA26_9PROT|nr:phosphonoacetaldehyde hydrolase [Rhodovibrio sodomensis]MBK1667272.1 phosphonoacetaldehyde hydrolase [Rhodovibrio sodomensis]